MTAVCWRCGKRVRIYMPAAGDGSVHVYSLHRNGSGSYCVGSKDLVLQEGS